MTIKFKIGDEVMLKKGLKFWKKYDSITFLPTMKFEGSKRVKWIPLDYQLDNGFIYSGEMLVKKEAK